jgi:uncharacterized protein
MRVVFDTNIVISGMLWGGTPREVLQLAKGTEVDAVTSEPMLDELRDVLHREKFTKYLQRLNKSVEQLVSEYLEYTAVIESTIIEGDVIRDIKDIIVLETAVGGDAKYIVSGDDDLLILKRFNTIKITDARNFLDSINSAE